MPLGGADAPAARAAAGRIHHGRRPHADPRRCPHHRRDPSRSAPAHPPGPVPRGSVLSPQRRADSPAAAARAQPRTSRRWRGISSPRRAARACRSKSLDQAAMERLKAYRWPGNVRELENLVRRLAALYSQEVIGVDVIEAELAEASPAQAAAEADGEENLSSAAERHLRDYFAAHKGGLPPSGLYDRVLREIERPLIQLTLERDPRQPAPGGPAPRPQSQHAAQKNPRIGHRCRSRPKIMRHERIAGARAFGPGGSALRASSRSRSVFSPCCRASPPSRCCAACGRAPARRISISSSCCLNLVLLLPLVAIVAWRLVQVWAERRRGLAGSRLHVRLVVLFSLVAVIPTIIVAVFSYLLFSLRRPGLVQRARAHRGHRIARRRRGLSARASADDPRRCRRHGERSQPRCQSLEPQPGPPQRRSCVPRRRCAR